MAYLGTPPQSGFISQEANQYFTGLTQNYIDLNQSINSLSSVIILVNGVVQENSTLTLTTSTRISLGATLVASDKVTCIYLAKISSTQAPDTGTVTNDMLAGSITDAKISDLASSKLTGTIPTARLGSGTASSSTFLRGDSTFAEAGGGKILQMQNMTTSTQTEVTSTTYANTAITDSITPSATSSKIMIIITDSCQYFNKPGFNDNGMSFRLKRSVGGSDTNVYTDNNAYEGFYQSTATGDPNFRCHITLSAIDSPNTTSACTYTHQINVYRDGSGAKARSVHDSNRGNMILLEIGA